jgi:predicted nucleic acid-binding protein
VAIPVVTLGEYRFGITQSRRRADYERWLLENLPDFRILPVEAETTEAYAEIRLELKQTGTPIPVNDLWIAALARQHRLPILSRDRHFAAVKGIQCMSW